MSAVSEVLFSLLTFVMVSIVMIVKFHLQLSIGLSIGMSIIWFIVCHPTLQNKFP